MKSELANMEGRLPAGWEATVNIHYGEPINSRKISGWVTTSRSGYSAGYLKAVMNIYCCLSASHQFPLQELTDWRLLRYYKEKILRKCKIFEF